MLSNSDWTDHEGVIGRVTSKWAERAARGRFEITSTITLWIVRHEVQLLINRISKKIRGQKVFQNLICLKKSKVNSIGCTNSRKTAKKNPFKCTWLTREWRRCPITGIQLEVVQIGHPRDRAPISNSNWTEWSQKPIRVETCNVLWFALYKAFAHSFTLSTIFGKSRKSLSTIFGLNSQRAQARARWRNLVFEQAWLNKVKFG